MSAPAAGVITLRDLRSLGCTVEDAPAIERTASVQETVQEGREIQEVGPSQSRKLPGAKLAGRLWPGHRRTGSRARSESGELEARTGLLREAEQQHAEADEQPAWVHALQWRSGANLFEQAAQVQATTAAGGRARVEPADAERHSDDHEDRKARRKQQLRKVGGKSASIDAADLAAAARRQLSVSELSKRAAKETG